MTVGEQLEESPEGLILKEELQPAPGGRRFSLWNFWICSLFLKLLLVPDYYSTDFDVHRNWLAITNALPLREWYYEKTSQWTLDYPPFFAYFEWVLSQFVPAAVRADGCLDIVPQGVFGALTVLFQRCTVIASEVLLFVVLQVYINTSPPAEKTQSFVVASSIVLSPMLLIVDHIHFQYNGFLFAILIASIVAARKRKFLLCAFFYSTALCFKHIFLYLAPCYFMFLLRTYVLQFEGFRFKSYKDLFRIIHWGRLFKLGGVVLGVAVVCFAPFARDMPQLLSRLFPFSRGLTHAYWAPNFWALYSLCDKVLTVALLKVPLFHRLILKVLSPKIFPASLDIIRQRLKKNANHGTKGLVEDVYFVVLPQITPATTFLLTLLYQVLAVLPLLFDASFKRFLGSLTLCGFASFLFGWHVHEKAIMLVIIPFSFLVVYDRRLLTSFKLVTTAGYVSLFPLLYKNDDYLIKTLYTYVWCVIYFFSLAKVIRLSSSVERRVFFLDRLGITYMCSLILLVSAVHLMNVMNWKYSVLEKYQFLTLMCYSFYCSFGILGSWLGLSWLFNFDEPLWQSLE
ncbi:dolichyl-P-Glc:Glc1Man(9)GlcNAc(2)-PP-dolichol alpha-1,3-glucosyltransferase KNAG_0L01920 [Huiozyma naganishii CBS 8797]|uniref:Alpha-1,3-glucosyltransferase n=1 Tax=Huiozyma naganishii (strain ATCC MYA-139 / BCRC 22969 / CBS 8797 / KCTC 17520 / NBRC 10181 / NCYC 3082 / Yp74L-3) TaxID=1071383 RepID=J7SB75_HUIN7|nr:hypothetical protein KNAG_0L01920 [Kazachstania naganishii CBS 8797]CCK72811.1 hypothetical protein KNAG_0L01920 [Kazachstania naganishii CBS 8797]